MQDASSGALEWQISWPVAWRIHRGNVFIPMHNEGELAVMQCFEFLFFAVAGAGAWSVDATRRRRQQGARTS